MERVQVDGFDFKYLKTGNSGPLVILFHGYGGGPLDWRNFWPTLAQSYQVIIPNITPVLVTEKPISFSKQVEIMGSLINKINKDREPFVLIGSSYGGTLTWGLRAHFQSLVVGHILINPMPLNPVANLKSGPLRMLFGLNMVPGALPLFLKSRLGQELLAGLGETLGFVGVNSQKKSSSWSERKLNIVNQATQRFAWVAQHEDWAYWSEPLRDHCIPLLVMTGGKDALFHENSLRNYQNLVPLSEHVSFPQGDHLMVRHCAADLLPYVMNFISSLKQDQFAGSDSAPTASWRFAM